MHSGFLWRVLWALWVVVIVGMTTLPWSDFQGEANWEKVCWFPCHDTSFSKLSLLNALANYLLFLPLGYSYVRGRSLVTGQVLLEAIALAALLSLGAELYQVFSHVRVPSMTDVVSNLTGATIGAALASASRNRSAAIFNLIRLSRQTPVS